MRIDILSCVPELLKSPFSCSIIKRAIQKEIVQIYVHNLRDFSTDKHRRVDDYPFGGGAGMVLSIEPIAAAIRFLRSQRKYDKVILMTPDGELLNQKIVNQLSLLSNVIILCGHYKGVDERVKELFVDLEISIGNYVLSGGELPAAVLVDAIVRLIPGAISDEISALTDSFQDNLLSPPLYTRPANFEGYTVPEILLSGDHKKIEEWRMEQAVKRTKERRPDLFVI